METYETSATVEDQGQVHLAAVPFAPGTEVEVTIREKTASDTNRAPEKAGEARVPMRELFARVQARNTQSVGPLRREELYDRTLY